MDISRKTLIISVIVNIAIILICVACLIVTKFNPIAIGISVAVLLAVLTTSIIVFVVGKRYKKQ